MLDINLECQGHEYVQYGELSSVEYCPASKSCPEAKSDFDEAEWDMTETWSDQDLYDEDQYGYDV